MTLSGSMPSWAEREAAVRYTGDRVPGTAARQEKHDKMTQRHQGPSEELEGEPLDEGALDEIGLEPDETEYEGEELEGEEPEPYEAEEEGPESGAAGAAGAAGRAGTTARGAPGRGRAMPGRGAPKAAPTPSELAVHIDDRISMVFAAVAALALLGVLAYGVLLGYGGLFTKAASPSPVPSASTPAVLPGESASPVASGSGGAASPSVVASPSVAVSPSAS